MRALDVDPSRFPYRAQLLGYVCFVVTRYSMYIYMYVYVWCVYIVYYYYFSTALSAVATVLPV